MHRSHARASEDWRNRTCLLPNQDAVQIEGQFAIGAVIGGRNVRPGLVVHRRRRQRSSGDFDAARVGIVSRHRAVLIDPQAVIDQFPSQFICGAAPGSIGADLAFQQDSTAVNNLGFGRLHPQLNAPVTQSETTLFRELQVGAVRPAETYAPQHLRAVAVSRIITPADLDAVVQAVVVCISDHRQAAVDIFVRIGQLIAIKVLVAVSNAVAIAVPVVRIGADLIFDQVGQSVLVRIVVNAVVEMADIFIGVVICGQVGEIARLGRGAAMPDAARIELVVVAADNDFLAVNQQGHVSLHGSARVGEDDRRPRHPSQHRSLATGIVSPVAGRDGNRRSGRAAGVSQVQVNLVAALP